jgi:hypothetical protein
MLNKPLTILPNSTLNQKFNIFQDEVPYQNEYSSIQYIAIGNKGVSYEVTSDNFVLVTPIPHSTRHASLYNHIPYILRPAANDLSAADRLKYRMRVPLTINNTAYIAYYLLKLDLTNVTPTVELRNVQDSNITVTNFTPDPSDLAPAPINISNVNINNPNGDYLASSAKINFSLSQQDVSEIIDACTIMYGDPRYAFISELALVAGIDRNLTSNNTLTYTEVVAAQVTAFVSQYHALTENSTGVSSDFDIGSVEQLIV